MKRLSKLHLTPLLLLIFLLPVHATEARIINRKHRDEHYLKQLIKDQEDPNFDCCAPIVHRPKTDIHPHILNDYGLLAMGYLKRKAPKSIVVPVPGDVLGVLVRYMVGNFDKNHFDKICFVHNDTGAFIARIPKANKTEGVYRVKGFQIHNCRDPRREKCQNILVCKAFTTRYGSSGRDKHGYDRDGYDRDGYDKWGNAKVTGEGHISTPSSDSLYDKEGYDRHGYNREGYDKDGYGIHGYNKEGYDEEGYDGNGHHKYGYNEDGYDIYGYDEEGYDRDGYDRDGNNQWEYEQDEGY